MYEFVFHKLLHIEIKKGLELKSNGRRTHINIKVIAKARQLDMQNLTYVSSFLIKLAVHNMYLLCSFFIIKKTSKRNLFQLIQLKLPANILSRNHFFRTYAEPNVIS